MTRVRIDYLCPCADFGGDHVRIIGTDETGETHVFQLALEELEARAAANTLAPESVLARHLLHTANRQERRAALEGREFTMLMPLAGMLSPLGAARSVFSPSALAGLIFDFDAQVGVTGTNPVTAWTDRTGVYTGTKAGSGTLTWTAAAINGKPSIDFDGAAYFNVPDANALSPAAGITLYAIANPSSVAVFRVMAAKNGSAEYRLNVESSRYSANVAGSGNAQILSATTGWKAWRVLYDNTRVALKVTGFTEVTVARVSSIPNSATPLLIGAGTVTPTLLWLGGISRLIAYAGELSAGDQARLETYLNTQYGLTP